LQRAANCVGAAQSNNTFCILAGLLRLHRAAAPDRSWVGQGGSWGWPPGPRCDEYRASPYHQSCEPVAATPGAKIVRQPL